MPAKENSPATPVTSALDLLRRIARRVRRRSAGGDPALQDIAFIEASHRFDKQWYLKQYPDVAASGMDPIQHYVKHGAAEGRNPTESFSTTFYLESNPDVAASGINPFRHYLEHGLGEGRVNQPRSTVAPARSDAKTIAQSGVFDSDFYLATYPGAVRSGMDPVEHYLQRGAYEGKNPCALFDTQYYLTRNPDVAASGMNPLVHFCRHGFQELRDPSPGFDIGWYWLTHLRDDVTTNPLAHYLSEGSRDGLEVHPVDELSDESKAALTNICAGLLKTDDHARAFCVRLGILLTRLAIWPDAETAFRRALAMAWDDVGIHARLATILAKQGKWWQAVESWTAAINLDASRASWFFHLGEAQEKMNRFALAAEAYRRAIEREPDHPDWYYRLGYGYEKSGDRDAADSAYAEAVARDPRDEVKAFGVGAFHQARGYWPEAAEAYARELESKPASAELHFKLGMAHDRCYRWQQAEATYRNAIALKPVTPYWHYRYGFVLERQQRWLEAADAYAAAAALSPKPMSYWHYRCGYVLAETGKHEEACLAYIWTHEKQTLSGGKYEPAESGQPPDAASKRLGEYLAGFPGEVLIASILARDTTDPQLHYQLGEIRERREDWAGASKAYADAVARSNPHRPAWYYRLGFVLFRAGCFEEACRSFRETRILRRPFGVDIAKYQKDAEQKMLMEYNEYLETLPIRGQHILYESMHGTAFGGNPRAIYECMVANPRYAGWTHVWVLAGEVRVPSDLSTRPNVIVVERSSDLYRRYLATASHLVNDVTFPYWFIRRPEQKYLNTWHGTPLKKLGKHIPDEFMAHSNIQRNFLHATHLISPNPHTSDVLMESYDIGGILSAKLAEVGYPRIDRMLHATPARGADVRAELGLAGDKPVVLYAPTWRGAHGHAQFDVERLREDIDAVTRLPCQVVFRGHHMVEEMLGELDLPVAIARQEMDTSDVLAITDILITDYSSIFFDFLPLRRPILYYAHDEREYATQRGLYFDIRSMPGSFCEDRQALLTALARHLQSPFVEDKVYASARARFCPHEDGMVSVRTIAFFLEDDDSRVVNRYIDTRRSLLFFNGLFPPNGITSSFLNLVNALAAERRDQITVAIEPERIAAEPTWLEKLRQIPTAAKLIGRVGRAIQSPEECWIGERYRGRRVLDTAPMWRVLQGAYEREFRRIFGNSIYDSVVNFEGYSAFWTTLLGFGVRDMLNVSYLHNDMVEEFRIKHPYLRANFGAYRYYDRLVSVSRHMSDVNRQKLGTEFGLQPSVFVPCINSLDVEQIRRRAREPLDEDLAAWMDKGPCFLSIGRMSPEKDHAKLVAAFTRVHAGRPDARLVILGDGPLRDVLKMQIVESGLQNAVFLAGLRKNPFPALARCQCFVLASNHEGQPMVLLETMTLGRPIIATDIDGNRGVLGTEYGMLVENSLEGLEEGMRNFLRGDIRRGDFDAEAYSRKSIATFRRIVEDNSSTGPVVAAQSGGIDIRSNRIVVAARADGLGERMNALLNGMYLAKRLGFDFAYHWSSSGTWEKSGADVTHHAIVPNEEFFSPDFISRYSLKKFNASGFREVSGKGMTEADILSQMASEKFKGWLAPRVGLNEILDENLAPDTAFNLGKVFETIGFSATIETAKNAAKAVELPVNCAALHLRSGDIFYGPYRKLVHYSYKGITLPIAKAVVQKIREDGGNVLLFGQDGMVMKYLKSETGAFLLADVQFDKFDSPAAQAIFELVLMSRCNYIIAGSSGFAKQASWIGNIPVKQPKEIFSHLEQTRISMEDLARNAEKYHPLQTAFAYWYAYYYGRQFKSPELIDELLGEAAMYDPDNQLYPMKRAFNFYRVGRIMEGEAIMKNLIRHEYEVCKSPHLPVFDILVAKTLTLFNLGEDFEFISTAAKTGAPFAAACNYLIARANNKSGLEELRAFDSCRGSDSVLASLYADWSSQ